MAKKSRAADLEPGVEARTRPIEAAAAEKQARKRQRALAAAENPGQARSRKPRREKVKRPKKQRAPEAATSPPTQAGPGEGPEDRSALFEQLSRHASLFGIDTPEGRFVFPATDEVGRSLFVGRGRPEFRAVRRAVAIVEGLLGESAIAGRGFIHVGAGIGTTTISAMRAHGFGSAVACEPQAESHRLLVANLVLNDLLESTRALRVAASDRSGTGSLVVIEGSDGMSWVASADEQARQLKAGGPPVADAAEPALSRMGDLSVEEVELTTLDALVAGDAIDADAAGMLWIGAGGHDGNVLGGAGDLVGRGVPAVFELDPRAGDRGRPSEVIRDGYTHFVDLQRHPAGTKDRPLQSSAELDEYTERLGGSGSTDLLLLRLDSGQAARAGNLTALAGRRLATPAARPGG